MKKAINQQHRHPPLGAGDGTTPISCTDADFAAERRFGRLEAPQSFALCTDDGHGATPACVGRIPGGGSEKFGRRDEWIAGLTAARMAAAQEAR
jgi:hypothetical protein